MKILYAARMARFDLLRAVNKLATYIVKWDDACDKRLYRLVGYINTTLHLRQIGWVGDSIGSVVPCLYAGADFAGCYASQKYSTGVHFAIEGEMTRFPILGLSI